MGRNRHSAARRVDFLLVRVFRHDPRPEGRDDSVGGNGGCGKWRPRQLDHSREDGHRHGWSDGPCELGVKGCRDDGARGQVWQAQNSAVVPAAPDWQGCGRSYHPEMGVFDIVPDVDVVMVEIAPGVTVDEVQAVTGCKLHVADNLIEMRFA